MYLGGRQIRLNSKVEELFHVLLQKLAMEIIPDGVIDETLGSLCFATSLVLKNNIVIPPAIMENLG